MKAAYVELHLIAWRIVSALRAYPPDAGYVTECRWQMGITRELWRAVYAIGMAAAGSVMNGQSASCKEVPPVLQLVLESARFNGTTMELDFKALDCAKIIAAFADGPDFSNTPLSGELWWDMPEPGSADETVRPTWWESPSSAMARPALAMLEDFIDLCTAGAEISATAELRSADTNREIGEEKKRLHAAKSTLARTREWPREGLIRWPPPPPPVPNSAGPGDRTSSHTRDD